MRLVSFEQDGRASYGCLDGERVLDFNSAPIASALSSKLGSKPTTMVELIKLDPEFAAAKEVVRAASRSQGVLTLPDCKLLAPIPVPLQIFAIGRNYSDHLLEAGADKPARPRIFPKYASTVIGPNEPITKPAMTNQLDWEVELAVVIGKTADRVSRGQALEYVAGYTLINDVSARDIQFSKPEQLALAKNFRTFCPMGSWIVTKDEAPDPGKLDIRLTVNGAEKQHSNTSKLIFSVQELVEFLSLVTTLYPGDLISTGTPEGVGVFRDPPEALKAGDVVKLELGDICELTNPVVDDGE